MIDFASLIDDRPEDGVFRVSRRLLTDPDLFDLEMRYIWESSWVFLGIETQLPKAHDFITGWIGRQPVLVTRDGDGQIHGFLNTCRHRGARLCATERGNRKFLVCPYHGWAWDTAGHNVNIKDREAAQYCPAFDEEDHDLVPLPRFVNYKGLLFGGLDPDLPPFEEHLGEAKYFVDLVMDQGERGMEFVPGRMRFVYRGNWKLQAENNLDYYHLTSTHPSFMEIVKRRQEGESANSQVKSADFYARLSKEAGMFAFERGHAAIWMRNPAPADRPLHAVIDRVRDRVGDLRAEWMLNLRNLLVYPSVQLADSTSLIVRVMRPLAVDRTEVSIYCFAPIGEDPAERTKRIRQHEDFFGASGLANPDDSVVYEDCQIGAGAHALEFHQGYARGLGALTQGPDGVADQFGIKPVGSLRGPFDLANETVFHAPNREWLRLMQAGAAKDAARGPK